jgi:protein O-GlcNAc transferase
VGAGAGGDAGVAPLLKNRAPATPGAVAFLRERLTRAGVDVRRVEIRGHAPSYPQHLETYREVDIALDTTPYNGTTTVCDALLMGVPIVGVYPDATHDRHAARVTLSLLSGAGMPELIAADEDALVERCAELASDPVGLNALRPRLRERLLASAVCDAGAFAERFWAALRGMWRERVARAPGGLIPVTVSANHPWSGRAPASPPATSRG